MKQSEIQLLGSILVENRLLESSLVEPEMLTQKARPIYEFFAKRIRKGGITPPQFIDAMARRDRGDDADFREIAVWGVGSEQDVVAASLQIIDEHVDEQAREILQRRHLSGHDFVQDALDALSKLPVNERDVQRGRLFDLAVAQYQSLEGDELKPALPTGLDALDRCLAGGLRRGEFVLVAGRPSMGKSTLARVIAMNVAKKNRVLFFSAEDSQETFVSRAVCSVAGVDLHRYRSRRMDDDEWARVAEATTAMRDLDLTLVTSPNMTARSIVSTTKQAMASGEVDLIVVDYLGMIAERGERRTEAVGAVSQAMKNLAKVANCPLIGLSQLNRDVEKRPNKRPVKSDLRDSGDLEQDADTIIFVYRDEEYNEGSKDAGIMEAIIGKQRNGPAGPHCYAKLPVDMAKGRVG